jgi:hypothetical protein
MVRADKHSDRPGRLSSPHRANLYAPRFEIGDKPAPGFVIAHAGHEAHGLADRGRPRTEVGRLAAAPDGDRRRRVVVRLERALGDDRNVQHQVADGDDHALSRITTRVMEAPQMRYAEFMQLRLVLWRVVEE